MQHLCIAVVASMLGAMSASAADSICGAKHNTSAEHGGKKMSDRDCTLTCLNDHNAKYVFVNFE